MSMRAARHFKREIRRIAADTNLKAQLLVREKPWWLPRSVWQLIVHIVLPGVNIKKT